MKNKTTSNLKLSVSLILSQNQRTINPKSRNPNPKSHSRFTIRDSRSRFTIQDSRSRFTICDLIRDSDFVDFISSDFMISSRRFHDFIKLTLASFMRYCCSFQFHDFIKLTLASFMRYCCSYQYKPEDEILLRKVLFDAVILVEYPFLYQNANYIKNLTLSRLIVTHEAIEYFRELDQNRAVSYAKAFSASHIPSQIIKLVTSQNGLEEKSGRATGSSPGALIKLPAGTLDGKTADDGLFYVDTVGEEGRTGEEDKQNELISDAFVAAAQSMKLNDNGIRKRKGKSKEKKIKFVKYDIHENSVPEKAGTSAPNDSSSGESEVEDPVSDSDA